MAKMYKVEMYVLDINNQYKDLDEIIIDIENSSDCNFNCFNVGKANFRWDDNIDVNFKNQPVEVYRKYFK